MPEGGEPPEVQLDVGPIPTRWDVGRVKLADGTQSVVLKFFTPQGVTALFFDGDAAERFGMQVANAGRQARIVIAPATILHTGNGHKPSEQ